MLRMVFSVRLVQSRSVQEQKYLSEFEWRFEYTNATTGRYGYAQHYLTQQYRADLVHMT